jgi:hypothetical protein
VVNIRIYVEGGGESNALRTRCRRAFSEFLRKGGLEGRMPRIIACGTRRDAYDAFCTAVLGAENDTFPILLVDSEAPLEARGPWAHLKARDDWDCPANATDDSIHLMVECMEAWFLADRAQLAAFYGQGYSNGSLPNRTDVENIPKSQVLRSLTMATRQARTKGAYDKGAHAFELLGKIDPAIVRKVAPYANRLLVVLASK